MIISLSETSITYVCWIDGLEYTVDVADLTAGSDRSPYEIALSTAPAGLFWCGDHFAQFSRQRTREEQSYSHVLMVMNGLHRWLYDNAQVHATWATFLDDEAAADPDTRPLMVSDDVDAVPLAFQPTGVARVFAPLVKLVTDGGAEAREVKAWPHDLAALLKVRSLSECQRLARAGQIFAADDDSTIGAFATAIFGETKERDDFSARMKLNRSLIVA